MKKLSNLFWLFLLLSVIAGVLIFWRLFLYQPPVIPPEIPFPTPALPQFISPSPIPLQEGRGESPADILRSLQEKFPLAAFLPYETEVFSIDYSAPLSLRVEIKTATQTAQIKKEVFDWIWSKGVNPATHQINWVTPGL